MGHGDRAVSDPANLPTSGRTFEDFWRSLAVVDHGIYRAYDAEGRLLYVGITRGLRARFRQHFEESPWVADIARLEFDPGYTEAEARAEEERQIKQLRPLHNKVHALYDRTERTGPLPRRERYELVLSALAGENKTLLALRHDLMQLYRDLRRFAHDLHRPLCHGYPASFLPALRPAS